jgi:DNA-binding LacI/PurR family transcriptional regulator
VRPRPRTAGADARARALLHGVHRRRRVELRAASIALTIQLVRDVEEEIAVYRRWCGEHRVDGVLVVDLRVDDPRVDELVRLGLPAVVDRRPARKARLPAVWHDEAGRDVEAVQYLAALGHTRIAHVAGVGEFVHTEQRTRRSSA